MDLDHGFQNTISGFQKNKKEESVFCHGISGLAQVKGRNGIDILEKIDYDLQYIDNMNFKQDLKLVFETILAVFSEKDAEITEQGIKAEIKKLQTINVELEKKV